MKNLIVLAVLLVACVAYSQASIYCYFCATCPIPFTPNAPGVTTVVANTGFCAKLSYSTAPGAPYSLGAAEPGRCVVTGCRWAYDASGRQVYTCCCNGNYCNGSM